MFKCDKCMRILKSKAGLVRHSKSCKVEVVEVKTEEVIDIKKLNKIRKLRAAITGCRCAETKHDYEMELKKLTDS